MGSRKVFVDYLPAAVPEFEDMGGAACDYALVCAFEGCSLPVESDEGRFSAREQLDFRIRDLIKDPLALLQIILKCLAQFVTAIVAVVMGAGKTIYVRRKIVQ